jgi:hypothetical protein
MPQISTEGIDEPFTPFGRHTMIVDLATFNIYTTISYDAEQDNYECTPMTQGLVPCSLPMRFKLPNTDKYAIVGHAMSKKNRDLLLTLNTTTLQYELKHCHRTQTTIKNLRTATLRPYPQEIHTIPFS